MFEMIYKNKFRLWLWESASYHEKHPFLSSGGKQASRNDVTFLSLTHT